MRVRAAIFSEFYRKLSILQQYSGHIKPENDQFQVWDWSRSRGGCRRQCEMYKNGIRAQKTVAKVSVATHAKWSLIQILLYCNETTNTLFTHSLSHSSGPLL